MPVTNSFTANTQAVASEVNEDFLYMTDIIDKTGTPYLLVTQGGNTQITNQAGDLLFSVPGGDVRLIGGTDLKIFDNTNTQNGEISMGTNLDITTTSGDVSLSSNSHIYNFGGTTNSFVVTVTSNTTIAPGTGDLYIIPAGGDCALRSGTKLVINNSTNTTSSTFEMGTNLDITTTSGDVTISPAGGDVRLIDGTDLQIFNVGNTQNGEISMGTNLDITTTSGDITMSPFGNVNITSIALTHDVKPVTASAYTSGSSSLPWAVLYSDQIESGNFTYSLSTMSFSVGSSGGFDFNASSANQYIKIPTISGSPGSPANGMIWYDTATGDFKGYKGGAVRTFTLT